MSTGVNQEIPSFLITNAPAVTKAVVATDNQWFCLQTHPKHEHIAAANVRKMMAGVDVFNPRFRIRRATRRGLVWFNEPLFPTYLFVQFDVDTMLDRMMHVPTIKGVIRFGDRIPSIPDPALEELRKDFDVNDLQIIGDDLASGDEVTIARGPFQGLQAVVLRILSAPQRVQVLLEMLGQSISVEVPRDQLISPHSRGTSGHPHHQAVSQNWSQ